MGRKEQYNAIPATGEYKRVIHPDTGKRVLEHRLVWEQHHGKIPRGWIVHHKNGNRSDNRIENLEAMTQRDHMRIHAGWKKDAGGNWLAFCQICERHEPEIEFYWTTRSGSAKSTRSGICVECFSVAGAEYYQENRERKCEYARKYRARKNGNQG